MPRMRTNAISSVHTLWANNFGLPTGDGSRNTNTTWSGGYGATRLTHDFPVLPEHKRPRPVLPRSSWEITLDPNARVTFIRRFKYAESASTSDAPGR